MNTNERKRLCESISLETQIYNIIEILYNNQEFNDIIIENAIVKRLSIMITQETEISKMGLILTKLNLLRNIQNLENLENVIENKLLQLFNQDGIKIEQFLSIADFRDFLETHKTLKSTIIEKLSQLVTKEQDITVITNIVWREHLLDTTLKEAIANQLTTLIENTETFTTILMAKGYLYTLDNNPALEQKLFTVLMEKSESLEMMHNHIFSKVFNDKIQSNDFCTSLKVIDNNLTSSKEKQIAKNNLKNIINSLSERDLNEFHSYFCKFNNLSNKMDELSGGIKIGTFIKNNLELKKMENININQNLNKGLGNTFTKND